MISILTIELESIKNRFRHADFAVLCLSKRENEAFLYAQVLFDACQHNPGFFEGKKSEFPFDPDVINRQINEPSTEQGVYLGATHDEMSLLAFAGSSYGVSAERLDQIYELWLDTVVGLK